MTAVGTAKPMAQGQAMISTVTAATSARRYAGAGPDTNQTTNVTTASDDHHRHEDGGDPVGQPLDRRLGALRLLHQPDDLRQHRVRPHPRDLEMEGAVPVERGADDPVAGSARHRHRLAGEHGLVHVARAFEDHSVGGDLLAGTDDASSPSAELRPAGSPVSIPPRSTRAVVGRKPISRRSAPEVRPLARASSRLPSSTSAMIQVTAS